MSRKNNFRNFDLFSNFSFFVPDFKGFVMICLWFLVGALLGNLVALPIGALFSGTENYLAYIELVAYPIMFVPVLMYSAYKSHMNSFFGSGCKISSNHYKPLGGPFCAIIAALSTISLSFLADLLSTLLPPMPENLEYMLKSLTNGKLWIDIVCVSIFAPVFEEWLCRGMILRGLLNFRHKDKDGQIAKGIRPVWAIVASAVFFAVIHANPWQAVPAFLLGCLFGYVYYRTGSIRLTMLMHCVNNSFALILSRIPSLEECDHIYDVLPPVLFAAISFFAIAFLFYTIRKFSSIETDSLNGNCDEILAD